MAARSSQSEEQDLDGRTCHVEVQTVLACNVYMYADCVGVKAGQWRGGMPSLEAVPAGGRGRLFAQQGTVTVSYRPQTAVAGRVCDAGYRPAAWQNML